MYFILFLLVILLLIIYIIRNPTVILIPYNYLIGICYEKKVFYTQKEKEFIFPQSIILETEYNDIQKEFLNLYSKIYFSQPDKLNYNIGSQFITANSDFWEGWNTIVLKSFGHFSKNIDRCPHLKKYLENDNITSAFFSVLEPGKFIEPHYGPFKGILRYHLGILIPKGECYISVDDIKYFWKNGEGVLFDETYLHYVHNNTQYKRAILFIDVKRPLFFPLNILNNFILYIMGISHYNYL